MSGEQAPAPPGWYADPLRAGGWRWWDGTGWTTHAAMPGETPRPRPRLARWLSVPVALCGPVVALALAVMAFVAPLSVVAGVVPLAIVLPALAWLDRVEPEPRSSRVHAVLWGGTVAVVVALVVNVSVDAVWGGAAAAVVSAPLVEEAMKTLGVVWAVRRGEVDGVVDGVVYAGWVAIGFAAVEDVTYFASAESVAQWVLVVVLRALLTPFAHPLFTVWAGIAIGRCVRDGRRLWPHAAWGYALAVAAHAAWNGSLTVAAPDADTGEGGGPAVLLIVVPLFVGLFVAVTVALVKLGRSERRRFIAQTPFLTQRYGLTPDEQEWFAGWPQLLAARRSLPRRARRRFDEVHAALARLALLHRRLADADPAKEAVLAGQLDDARRRLTERR